MVQLSKASKLGGLAISLFLFFSTSSLSSTIRGLYVSDETMYRSAKLKDIVSQAKAVGINLFVVDLYRTSPLYEKNLQVIKDSGTNFIVRVVVFPGGALGDQVRNSGSWAKKLDLVDTAHRLGAQQVQLDYIRYSSKQAPSKQNAEDILTVIKAFKERTNAFGLPLQIAVFGISSFKPVETIGQNLPLFASSVDVMCPMLYPSHFEPYVPHSQQPYKTVFDSLGALKNQFNNQPQFKILPYIETFNYRYPLSPEQRRKYIAAQIQAALHQGSEGFIAWSANNIYHHLFAVLQNEQSYFSSQGPTVLAPSTAINAAESSPPSPATNSSEPLNLAP
jgi:hypothetical protein